MDTFEKWQKAVVHLECARDTANILKETKRLRSGEISRREFEETLDRGARAERSRGTSVFLTHNNRRYLITARHVMHDHQSGKEMEEYLQDSIPGNIPIAESLKIAENFIFNMIFRVPSLIELSLSDDSEVPAFLMNLGAGTVDMHPFTFSSTDVDLAVISLDQRDAHFADELICAGYVPITLDDIADGPSGVGAAVFSVGFPESIAVVGNRPLTDNQKLWASKAVSVPTLAFGNVSMLSHDLGFYWCDISVYPGNSGGPVVENGKLVGLVSAQPWIPSEIHSGETAKPVPLWANTRIPFSCTIKASFIKELLEIQIRKDAASCFSSRDHKKT